jgi:hypothetical protein
MTVKTLVGVTVAKSLAQSVRCRNNDHQVIRNMQSGKINVEDLEDYYDDHG